MATAVHAYAAVGSSFKHAPFFLRFNVIFDGFAAETGVTYERKTLVSIGKESWSLN